MAVYEGARPRTIVGSGAPVGAGSPDAALARRRVRGAIRAGRRSNRVGILLGVIVLAFLAAFFSLAQSMRVSAVGYEIERLQSARDELEAERLELTSDVARLSGGPAIRKQALDSGLLPLATPVVVEAR
jgi:cell division protein FtsB